MITPRRAVTSPARFARSRYFDLKTIAYDDRELDPLLRNNVIRAVIVIPEDFGQNIRRGRRHPYKRCWMAPIPAVGRSRKDIFPPSSLR